MKKIRRYLREGNLYGKLIMLVGILTGIPLIIALFYPRDRIYWQAFLLPAAISVLLGLAVILLASRKEAPVREWQSSLQKGSLPVLFAWCYGIFIGALPFVIGGLLSLLQALFESTSGWTTTGLSVITNIEETPRIYLFHRSFMQYCGGLGFIMMMVMLIHGKQSVMPFSAEGHTDRLMPNLKKTAQTIFLLYNSFLAAGVLLYILFGMDWFEALCHAMSALSTAGFTTRAASIAAFNSVPIEVVTDLLMLIGATNFAVLLLLARGKLKELAKIGEMRFLFGLLLLFIPLTAISLAMEYGFGFGKALHEAAFGVITTYSTTGFSTMNYAQWPPFAVGMLILLMLIGGGIGSTAGGIKLVRVYLLLRITRQNISQRMTPARRVSSPQYQRPQGKSHIDNPVVYDTVGFIAIYMGIVVVGTLIITAVTGCPLIDALYEFSSAFGTVGISNGLTGPDSHPVVLITEIVGMLLGRLEIFIVFIGLYTGGKALRRRLGGERKTARE